VLECGLPELAVHLGALRPCLAPVLPALERAGDLFEVGEQHAIRDEARRPMRDCRLDFRVLHTLRRAFRILSGVNGMAVTRAFRGRSASFTAFMIAPGAPAVPASPTPFAP